MLWGSGIARSEGDRTPQMRRYKILPEEGKSPDLDLCLGTSAGMQGDTLALRQRKVHRRHLGTPVNPLEHLWSEEMPAKEKAQNVSEEAARERQDENAMHRNCSGVELVSTGAPLPKKIQEKARKKCGNPHCHCCEGIGPWSAQMGGIGTAA